MTKIILFLIVLGTILNSCFSFSVPFSNGRIIGGEAVSDVTQFPYQVSLRKNGIHTCGGSIISDKWILTAAHCLVINPELLTVVAGTIFLDNGGQERTIKRFISHKEFIGVRYDVGLLELNEPLKFSSTIQPINLVHNEIPSGSKVIISGWGREDTYGPISNILKSNSKLSIMDQGKCKKAISGLLYYDNLVCLQHSVGNGLCGADSGGPAVFNGELFGVASFAHGDGCGTSNPDGYVKVSGFVAWINKETGLKL